MRKTLFGLVFLLACMAVAGAAEIKWAKNYASAKSQAKASGKLMMLDFYTDW